MASLIPFPLSARTRLVRGIVNDLLVVNGEAANRFWRDRIGEIVAELRDSGLEDAAIRAEIYGLQDAVQCELQNRSREASTGGVA